jgi:hypothetical protein
VSAAQYHPHVPYRTTLGDFPAADIVARGLTLLLIVLAIDGGLLLIGFIGYVVAACRRYQQATALDAAQQHHHRPRRLPPLLTQASSQSLGFPGWAVGEHADRAHTDHDLAGGRTLEATSIQPPARLMSTSCHPGGLTASRAQEFWIGA